MFDRKTKLSVLLIACVLLSVACSPAQQGKAPSTLVPFAAGSSSSACPQEEVIPKITQVQPDEILPGTTVTVSAEGGYLRDTCGGYIESARQYQIYLDDEPIAEMTCYVHHCEGKFTMPVNASAGAHCLGVKKGTCQMELDVTGG